ncbi:MULTISPECIES: YdcH family protein [Flavobacterium]|uniref:YdcH family protein n=1 Tax=Flavobacterium jumunjinense TaxID=998845 RepID=A0ABV5GP38_9FLAO|nr:MULTISPECIES: YdcH family protein [Flavobacterium]
MIKKHQLATDFPEFEEKIHDLKTSDNHFKKLFDDYDNLDHEIYRIESDTEPASDDTLNSLRVERVRIKDEIYSYLTNN